MPHNPHCSRRSNKQTTPKRSTNYKKIKITHPYHPRCGEEVEIIRKCGEDKIVVQTSKGERIVVANDWTEIDIETDEKSRDATHLLDYGGLVEVIELIERIGQKKGQSEEEGYDVEYSSQVKPSSEEQNESGGYKQRTKRTEPGVVSARSRSSGRRDPVDGAVGAEIGGSGDRKPMEGGGK